MTSRPTSRAQGKSAEVVIERPRASCHGDLHRVWADVEGEPLWFESDDVPLEPAPEAWASALLIPALQRGARIVSEAALSATWLANVERLERLLADWWGLPRLLPEAPAAKPAAPPAGRRAGLCFTGGTDSFYSALRPPMRVDDLVYVQGYNFRVDDRSRADSAERRLRTVAGALGFKPILVRTNLRQHPAYGERAAVRGRVMGTHLAAAGYVLAGQLGTLVITASWPDHFDRPDCVHPKLVSLLSYERLTIVRAAGEMWRTERLRAIAHHPLLRDHLSVCTKGAGGMNCSTCEKCVRTMLVLAQAGHLPASAAFRHDVPVAERLRRLPALPPDHRAVYEGILRDPLVPELERETVRLIRRSRRHTRWGRLYRVIAGWPQRRRARLRRQARRLRRRGGAVHRRPRSGR